MLLALIVISVVAILGFLLEKGVNKLLGVKKQKISDTPAKRIDFWGRGIILIIALLTLPLIISEDFSIMKWYWIAFILVSFGFQAFLEWKYLKKSKQYITTLIFLLFAVIFIYNLEYILPWS